MAAGTSYRTPGLGGDRFWRLRAAGASAPLDDAVARALSDTGTFDEPA